MKIWISILCIPVLLMVNGIQTAWAASDPGNTKAQNILLDTLYGAAAGMVAGIIISAPQGGDANWGGNIGAGIAIGAVAGLVYGFATGGKDFLALQTQPQAVVELQQDQDGADIAWPTVIVKTDEQERDFQSKALNTTYSISLLQYNF